jgi:hypothetical protein
LTLCWSERHSNQEEDLECRPGDSPLAVRKHLHHSSTGPGSRTKSYPFAWFAHCAFRRNRRQAGSDRENGLPQDWTLLPNPNCLRWRLWGRAPPPRGHVRFTDPQNLEPRFQLDSSVRPFNIDEYLCIIMDKYASRKKIRIGDGGDLKKI